MIFKHDNKYNILPFVFLITGCVNTYIEPVSGPMSTVTFSNSTNGAMWVNSYTNQEKCTGYQVVGMFNPGADITVKVKAGIPAIFSLGYIHSTYPENTTCTLVPTFIPKEKERYLLRIQLGPEENTCSLSMYKVHGVNQLVEFNDVVMRKFKKPIFESQGFCEEISKTEASSK